MLKSVKAKIKEGKITFPKSISIDAIEAALNELGEVSINYTRNGKTFTVKSNNQTVSIEYWMSQGKYNVAGTIR